MNRGGEVAGMKVGDGIGGQTGEIRTVTVNWETGLEAEQGISEQWRPVSSLNVGDGTRTVASTNRVNASSDSATMGQPGMISALGGPPAMNSGSTFGAHSGMHSAMGGPAGMYAGEQLGLPSVDMEDPWGLLSMEVEGPREGGPEGSVFEIGPGVRRTRGKKNPRGVHSMEGPGGLLACGGFNLNIEANDKKKNIEANDKWNSLVLLCEDVQEAAKKPKQVDAVILALPTASPGGQGRRGQ